MSPLNWFSIIVSLAALALSIWNYFRIRRARRRYEEAAQRLRDSTATLERSIEEAEAMLRLLSVSDDAPSLEKEDPENP